MESPTLLPAGHLHCTMSTGRRFAGLTVLLGLLTLAHALYTWPLDATVAFFGGGAILAFLAEAVVVDRGWLEHHIGPNVIDVPLYVPIGWTGTVYVAFRLALLGTAGWLAVVVAGVLATSYDVLMDHRGVVDGYWTFTDDLPGPRYRGVPWWNFVGWFLISVTTAAFARPFL